jgi:T1SS-143 domain-containing protein
MTNEQGFSGTDYSSDEQAGYDTADAVQIAQASTPPAPGKTVDVTLPPAGNGPQVVRVPVAPGDTIDLPAPFDSTAALAAREGDGNLAIKVGDVTVILQGYIAAANDPERPVVIESSDGKPIDVATVLATTDPAIDIQTAAGPGGNNAGGQGADNTGGILAVFGLGGGLGGFSGVGGQDQTELSYRLIDGGIRQEFPTTAAAGIGFGFSINPSSGSIDEAYYRDPAQTSSFSDFNSFLQAYHDAVDAALNHGAWADHDGTNVTTGDFAEYLSQTVKTATVDVNFTGATGDLVLDGIGAGLTSSGSTLHVELTDNGHTMFVRRDSDNALVAVVHVDGPSAGGEFTVDTYMINRLDHPVAGTGDAGRDTLNLEIDFTVYDGPSPLQSEGANSPSLDGSLNVSIQDDVPVLKDVLYHNEQPNPFSESDSVPTTDSTVIGLIDEDWLSNGAQDRDGDGNLNAGQNGDTDGSTTVTGKVEVNFGADGPALTDVKGEASDKHGFSLDTSGYHEGQPYDHDGGTLTSGGQTLYVLSVGADHLTVGIPGEGGGTAIFTLTLNQDTGEFTFTLDGPLDHPSDVLVGGDSGLSAFDTVGTENNIGLAFGVTATDDDGDHVGATINIQVNDDVPEAVNDSLTANATHQPTADIQFIMDVSISMGEKQVTDVPGFPDTVIGLERYAIQQMLTAHPEVQNVQFVLFSGDSRHTEWMTRDDALAYVQNDANFYQNAGTNYDRGLTEAMNAFNDSAKPSAAGDKTLIYFFSDGQPNTPKSDPGITNDGTGQNVSVKEWEDFVTDPAHNIGGVYAVGVGDDVTPSDVAKLNPIAYPNTDVNDPIGQEDHVLVVNGADISGVSATLNGELATPAAITGDLTSNDKSGGDGFGSSKLVSVSFDTDGSGAGTDKTTYTFDATHTQYTIDLGSDRGTLVINADGTYSYTPPTGAADGTPFTVDYTIRDGDGDTSTASLKIDLNAAPVLDLNGAGSGLDATAAFTEQTPVAIAAGGTLTDDGNTIASLTATLTYRPDGAAESLTLSAAAAQAAADNGLTVSFNASTGALQISGSASAAVYQTILQGIQYENSSDTPDTAPRHITIVANDGSVQGDAHQVIVSVSPVNDAPVLTLTQHDFTATEQTNLTLSGKGMSISDVDAGNGIVSVTLTVGEGALTITKGNSGVDTVTGNGTSSVTVTGTVTEINNLLGGIDTGTGTAGKIVFYDGSDTPSADTTLQVIVNDNANTGSGGALEATDSATIHITPVDDKPFAADDSIITNAGATAFHIPEWALLANDSDKDSSTIDLVSGNAAITSISGGSATHTDGIGTDGFINLTDTGGNGATFAYKITDGNSTDTAIVKVVQQAGTDLHGTSGNDIIIVGDTGSTVHAGDGKDIVIGGSGKDLIFGEGGDDTLIFGDGDKFDGGSGFDRLVATGGGHALDSASGNFLAIEMIDLGSHEDRSGAANQNSLTLHAADLIEGNAGSVGSHQITLFVVGDTQGATSADKDAVHLDGFGAKIDSGSFTDAFGATHTYDVYESTSNPAVKVAVEHGLEVS